MHALHPHLYPAQNTPPAEDLLSLDLLIDDLFYSIVSHLTNEGLLMLGSTCRHLRVRLVEHDLLRKAAWSISRKIPFPNQGKADFLEQRYQEIGIFFPELFNRLGTFYAVYDLPHIHLNYPIEQGIAEHKVNSPVMRGRDGNGKVFLAFRFRMVNPRCDTSSQTIALIYQTVSSSNILWSPLELPYSQQIALGAQALNSPVVKPYFLDRLQRLLAGSKVGPAEPRAPSAQYIWGKEDCTQVPYEEYPPYDENSPYLILC